MNRFSVRRIILFFLLVILGCLLGLIIHFQRGQNEQWVNLIISVGFPTLIGILSYVIKPWSNYLDGYLNASNSNNEVKRCTIYLFGKAGSGKTSLCESFGAISSGASRASTDSTDCYFLTKNFGGKNLNVAITDYKGQNPSEVTINLPEKYVGDANNRIINAALFVVDIVGRENYNNELLDTVPRQIAWLEDDTDRKVLKRVEEHTTYINGSLEIVFATIYSENLKSVRLVINKFDLIQKLLRSGHLQNSNNLTDELFAEQIFEKIINELQSACAAIHIQDFKVEFVSAKNDYNTRGLMDRILEIYSHFISRT